MRITTPGEQRGSQAVRTEESGMDYNALTEALIRQDLFLICF